MKDESENVSGPTSPNSGCCAAGSVSSPTAASATNAPSLPAAVDRAAFEAELGRLRDREKAHTREGDAIAAARRRLPMVEVDASTRADRARRAAPPPGRRSKGAGS